MLIRSPRRTPRSRAFVKGALRLCATAFVALGAVACSHQDRLEYVPVRSEVMQANLSYAVYTPPDFRADERLPLILFLHGGGDDPAKFEQHGVAQRLDEATEGGRIPRVVVVLPQGDNGFWLNWWDGSRRYEDWILQEILPEVARDYHTQACPEGCHVMGVSMGGAGTLRFALHHGEQFSSATVLSGPIFDTERMIEFASDRLYAMFIPTHRVFGPPAPRDRIELEDPFLVWRRPSDMNVKLFLGWAEGDRSGIKQSNEALAAHLTEAGIPHHAEEFAGDHKWTSWSPVIERAIAMQVPR